MIFLRKSEEGTIHRGAGKPLAFPVSNFSICSTTKRILLGWLKEV
jgi:hypothetical protein